MKLFPYQKRMLGEYCELDDRIMKLENLLADLESDDPKIIETDRGRDILNTQIYHMKGYRECLRERLDLEEIDIDGI